MSSQNLFTFSIFVFFILLLLNLSVFSTDIFAQEPRIRIDDAHFLLDQRSIHEQEEAPQEIKNIPDEKKDIIVIGYHDMLKRTTDFILEITNNLIDFGELSPTNPVIRQLRLSIINNITPSYTMYVAENRPLTLIPQEATVQSASEATQMITIPDTTCDTGTCTHLRSAPWTNTLTFGYGYRCDGQACPQDFSEADKYRQFPSISDNKGVTLFLLGTKQPAEVEAILTSKINLPGTQQLGTYENTTTLLLLPGY